MTVAVGWKPGGDLRTWPWSAVEAVRWVREVGSEPILLQIRTVEGDVALATKKLNQTLFDASALPDPKVMREKDRERWEEEIAEDPEEISSGFFDPELGFEHGDWRPFPEPSSLEGYRRFRRSGGREGSLSERKILLIQEAISRSMDLRFKYRSADQKKTRRTAKPESIVVRGRNPFLWAWCHLRKERRLFRVENMTHCQMVEPIDRLERPDPQTEESQMGPFSILNESVSGYAEPPVLRVTDKVMADLVFFLTIRNGDDEAVALGKDDIILACREPNGKLVFVGNAFDVNGKDEILVPPEELFDLRVFFLVPERLCGALSSQPETTLRVAGEVWKGHVPWLEDLSR